MKLNFRILFVGLCIPALNMFGATRFVDLNNLTPATPYLSWSSAATNIQDAIDVAVAGDEVLVMDGVYDSGGRKNYIDAAVAVTKAVTVRSVNGPAATVIQGFRVPGFPNVAGSVRGCYLTNGALLDGFTVQGGATSPSYDGNAGSLRSGGGIWSQSTNCWITNCVIVANSAADGAGGCFRGSLVRCVLTNNQAGSGGAADSSVLAECVVVGNAATSFGGGGAAGSTLQNCLVVGNTAYQYGGGIWGGTAVNCTIVSNTAGNYGGGSYQASSLRNCIIYYNILLIGVNPTSTNVYNTPAPIYCFIPNSSPFFGVVFTNAPIFVNPAVGDYRLASNSPCINSGINSNWPSGFDLGGTPRIVNGIIDVGAYEYQETGSKLPYVWLSQYGLAFDGSDDYADTDGDGLNTWQEWIAWTDPINSASALRILSVTNASPGLTITWQSAGPPKYFIERSTNLGALSAFEVIATNLIGFPPPILKKYTDATATGDGPYFYRVGIMPQNSGR